MENHSQAMINRKRKAATPTVSEKRQAYLRLKEMAGGFPIDFDPEKEIMEAREAKLGSVSAE